IGTLDELKANHPDKDLETIYLELAGRKAQEEG
ncbi:MAG: ABC transporter ATP-binding protein, partial [Streptococcus sp.]|nr:ABC transporter ATP-binding protein [Streptococcus sp.]